MVPPNDWTEDDNSTFTLSLTIGYIHSGDMAFGLWFTPDINSRKRVRKTETIATPLLDRERTETWDRSTFVNLGALVAMKLGNMSLGIGLEIDQTDPTVGGVGPLIYEYEEKLLGVVQDNLARKDEVTGMMINGTVGLNIPMGDNLLGFVVQIGIPSATDKENYVVPPAPGDRFEGEDEYSGMLIGFGVLPEINMGSDKMLKGVLLVQILSLDSEYKFTGLPGDGTENDLDKSEMSGLGLEIGGALNTDLTKDCKSILGLSFGLNSFKSENKNGNKLTPLTYNEFVMEMSGMNITLFLGLENNFTKSIIGRLGISTDLFNSSSFSGVNTPFPGGIANTDWEWSTSDVLGFWSYNAGISILPSENFIIDANFNLGQSDPFNMGFGSSVYKENIPTAVEEDTISTTEITVSLGITVKI